jgi:hypothetical protein
MSYNPNTGRSSGPIKKKPSKRWTSDGADIFFDGSFSFAAYTGDGLGDEIAGARFLARKLNQFGVVLPKSYRRGLK